MQWSSASIFIKAKVPTIGFKAIFNLFSPQCNCTINSYGNRSETDNIPGIKNDTGGWETRGHPKRVIHITEKELNLFAKLFEDESIPASHARLPQVHSQPLLKVLEKFALCTQAFGRS